MGEGLSAFRHRWVPGTGSRTLLLLHGTGGTEDDLLPLGETLDPSASLLSPRGRIDEDGANRFFRRFAEGVFDQENMRQETEALAGFLSVAAHEYGIGEDVYAVGFSNGANIGASLLFRHPDLLRGAILMRAMVPFEPTEPLRLNDKCVLITSGESDPMVSKDQAERLSSILTAGGAGVEHLWLPAGHNLTRSELERARSWLSEAAG